MRILSGRKLIRISATVITVAALTLTGCSGSVGTPDDGGDVGGVTISDTRYPPAVHCMLDAGATVIEVVGGYEFDMSGVQDPETTGRECSKLWNPARKTDAELRDIYQQWLQDADCLRGLGYHPDDAPSFETFVADWRADGPWMPIDGVNAFDWSPDEYAAAKSACGLDMYARD